ncbi:toll-like receptor 6 [Diadema setosum]|uniref:toll-like receptor 6 n=1 Tax=Diadema setosum TaxID=31175 RepID=UPI003B3AE8BC
MQKQQALMLLIMALFTALSRCQSSGEQDERTSGGVECSVCRCIWDDGQALICLTSELNASDPFQNIPESPDIVSVTVFRDAPENSGPLTWPMDDELVKRFPHVRSLNFDGCTFKTIEHGFLNGLSNLQSLTFFSNGLREIPVEALAPVAGSLRELDIFSQSGLTEIRNGDFRGLSNLSTLRLTGSAIYRLHVDSFVELVNLTTLSLDDNNLTDIPDNVLDTITKIETLDLSRNSLRSIPRAVDGLEHLQELDLSSNQISDIRGLDFLHGMKNLNTLSLEDNLILTLESDAIIAWVFNSSWPEVKLCHNPFLCDSHLCNLMPLYDNVLFSPLDWTKGKLQTCEYECASPLKYWGKPFKTVYWDICFNDRIDSNLSATDVNVPLLLMNSNKRMYAIGGGVGILAFAAVIFGVVVFIRFRRIKLMRGGFIFAGRGLRRKKNNGQEERLVYDAAVYHHDDEVEFVDERIRPRLENHPNNFRLCLPLIRDFRLGVKRLNGLRESLVASMCAVFVISRAFVMDARCRQALEVACDYLHRDDLGPPHMKQTSLILILLDPVLLENLPEAIRVLVDRLITLEWNNLDEERCWKRLEQSLHDFGRQAEKEV